ncbi:hypothetical protein F6455_01405 [Proteobacteria bacterium 005FR1]|nr:hypothetical protein [Proteobacteria bacterium 005FR1]
MTRIVGYLLLILAPTLLLSAVATFYSAIQAITVQSTLVAVESFIGTLVIAVAMLILARISFRSGMRRLKPGK